MLLLMLPIENALDLRGDRMNKLTESYNKFYEKRLKRLNVKLYWKQEEQRLRSEVQKNSHSILWIWEFSKKAVMICFLFYMIVQIYSMSVMVIYQDFTYLGELITTTGNLVENCVFMYLIKAGLENGVKIWQQHKDNKSEAETTEDTESYGPVG